MLHVEQPLRPLVVGDVHVQIETARECAHLVHHAAEEGVRQGGGRETNGMSVSCGAAPWRGSTFGLFHAAR